MKQIFLLSAGLLVTSCTSEPEQPDPVEPPVCGSANRAIPPDLTELAYDDGEGVSNITEQSWTVSGQQMRDTRLREAVGFALERPARVWGFAIQWAALPDFGFPALEVPASIYADFGYNGFDFWLEPTWTGSRCFEDLAEHQWVFYGLEEPLVVEQPGIVWVGHEREFEMPVFAFDGSTTDCAVFGACHSAWSLPEIDDNLYFNGVSLSSANNFMVRLYVEYEVDVARALFTDVTGSVTVSRRHAWGDYDDDGDDDLLTSTILLRNDAGVFIDVTESAGLAGVSMHGGVWGDYDNDGCLDLFAFSQSGSINDTLLRSNCDGTFTDVTVAAGIDDSQSYFFCEGDTDESHQPSHAAAWWDIDNDGYLDLYVANYACGSAYYSDQVVHNDGDGTFSDWSGQHGFSDQRLASRGTAPIDFDRDGDVDLLVHTYRLQANMMFVNDGAGSVVDSASDLGLAGHPDFHNGYTYYGHTIGAAWGDLDNDGDFDLIEANLAHPRFFSFSDKTRVLLQESGGFADISGDWTVPASAAGLRYQETHSVPVLADFDNDGVLDLAISAVYDGRPTDFYWGAGDGTFVLDVYGAGIEVRDGWGMAASDFDNDGDVDLAAKGVLLANTRAHPGHWLQVRPVGNVSSNRGAYGATVSVTTGARTQLRHVQGGSGQGGQDSAYLHFGLSDAATVDTVQVVFPGGATVDVGAQAADQRLWVFEDGTVEVGWTPPWNR